jgi:hypothetical protein
MTRAWRLAAATTRNVFSILPLLPHKPVRGDGLAIIAVIHSIYDTRQIKLSRTSRANFSQFFTLVDAIAAARSSAKPVQQASRR